MRIFQPGEGDRHMSMSTSPFHPGEQKLQARFGLRERIEQTGRRMVRDFMPDQHREFFEKLPFLIVGSLDLERRPWASILVGGPGFVRSPDPRRLQIAAQPGHGDPLTQNLREGASLGLLGIELETRRRNRMNGTVEALGDAAFSVRVGQSFGNCPKYIQARAHRFIDEPESTDAPRPIQRIGAQLSDAATALIARGDTFFIASAAPEAPDGDPAYGVDVSHRGGKPGFVRVTTENGRSVLTAPDFSGNMLFNTLGNLVLDPRAGLLFVDFGSGDLLSLTGRADVIWDGAELERFTGAERLLRFRPDEGLLIAGALPLRWSSPQQAPQLAATGSWDEVAERQPRAGR
jgi:uncharacterized protein